MKTGMLWFDPSGSLEERVRRAAAYYERKYGMKPNICYVERTQCTAEIVDGIAIKPDGHVLKNHLFLGRIDEQNAFQGG